ncbi:hypothetical protein VTJ04DRAFT_7626 [Mycothermus thermophilus]|uniref:uncharacterized protein n=1 Tax=Humicola insolens TaxID=85995 RepID=UPI003743D7FD
MTRKMARNLSDGAAMGGRDETFNNMASIRLDVPSLGIKGRLGVNATLRRRYINVADAGKISTALAKLREHGSIAGPSRPISSGSPWSGTPASRFGLVGVCCVSATGGLALESRPGRLLLPPPTLAGLLQQGASECCEACEHAATQDSHLPGQHAERVLASQKICL